MEERSETVMDAWHEHVSVCAYRKGLVSWPSKLTVVLMAGGPWIKKSLKDTRLARHVILSHGTRTEITRPNCDVMHALVHSCLDGVEVRALSDWAYRGECDMTVPVGSTGSLVPCYLRQKYIKVSKADDRDDLHYYIWVGDSSVQPPEAASRGVLVACFGTADATDAKRTVTVTLVMIKHIDRCIGILFHWSL